MKTIEFKRVKKSYIKGPRYYASLRQLIMWAVGGKKVTYEKFWALDGVSYGINQGETVGFIGSNGAGKSTSLKLISRVTKPESGEVVTHGSIAGLLELGAGFHPELTGRENIIFNGVLLGNKKERMNEVFDEIVEFANLGEFIDTPVKHFSSGMYARLGFAVAVFTDPDILLIDEVLSVGDEQFQNKCQKKIEEFRKNDKKTIVFVSHNLELVQKICSRVIWMEHGKVVADGKPNVVIKKYRKANSE